MELDDLIEEGREAPVRAFMGTATEPASPPNVYKPVPPEPGEPELISQTAPVRANGFRRRMMTNQQALERRLSYARALITNAWDEDKALAAAGYASRDNRHRTEILFTLRNHPDVISELLRLRLILEQRADVATIDLAKEWVGIAQSDIFDYFNESEDGDGVVSLSLKPKRELSKIARKSVKSIKIKRRRQTDKHDNTVETEDIEVQLWDKLSALDCLAKTQGIYQDKTADALDNLASKITQRTERARKHIGRTFDSQALEPPIDQQAG